VLLGDVGRPAHYVAIFSDVSTREAAEAQMVRLAYEDPMTGLANRYLFEDRLERTLAHVRRARDELAVLCLDLDGFKSVNDGYGHQAGDSVLREVARRLRRCTRETDTVARLGGDEFAILLVRLPGGGEAANEAERTGRRIVQSLRRPFALDEARLTIGVSVGIALCPRDANDAAGALRAADEAMYVAKAAGKGQCRLVARGTPLDVS
jgi:diguanylate cyclase (GGDEF)-like protein